MGLKVLELAENIRGAALSPTALFARSRQLSDAPSSPSTPLRSRRESLSSPLIIHSPYANCGGGVISELERARSKIQGTLLKESGIGSIELWRIALQMLATSRTILLDKENVGPEHFSFSGRSSHYYSPIRSGSGPFSPASFGLHVGSLDFQKHHPQILDTSPTWDGSSLAQATSPTSRKDTLNTSSSIQDVFSSAKATELKGTKLKNHKDLPGKLPEDIWVRIITLAIDPKDILSAKQRQNVVAWARTGDTLERERELAGKLRSAQIWRLLETLECLSCEV